MLKGTGPGYREQIIAHKKGLRGRFGMYIPPLMEELGLAEVEHKARNNRMHAK